MKDKGIVLITGASGGLGKAIIPVLHREGYMLALQADTRADELDSWLRKNDLSKPRIFKSHLDNAESCAALLADVVREMGEVGFLLNCAGINRSGSTHKLSASDFDEVLKVNLSVPFYLSALVAEAMIRNGFGRIVHISSVVAKLPVAGTVAYAASKSGLEGMARAQAADWAKFGITVNCVAPGYMDKGMIEQVPEKILDSLLQQIPARKLGVAEDIGELIAFLFSDHSSYINGQAIGINGGLL